MKKLMLFLIPFALVACNKAPGLGGSSSITGKVKVIDVVVGMPTDTTYVAEEDVYLLYGTDTIQPYNDSYKTSWNGVYTFEYLKKGSYTVFVYSEDYPNSNDKVPVFTTVEIDKNGQEYELEDLVIYK